MNNPNWTYYFSKELNMQYAVHNETGELVINDDKKTKYTFKEVQLLKNTGITKQIHNVKKVFKGEIIA